MLILKWIKPQKVKLIKFSLFKEFSPLDLSTPSSLTDTISLYHNTGYSPTDRNRSSKEDEQFCNKGFSVRGGKRGNLELKTSYYFDLPSIMCHAKLRWSPIETFGSKLTFYQIKCYSFCPFLDFYLSQHCSFLTFLWTFTLSLYRHVVVCFFSNDFI